MTGLRDRPTIAGRAGRAAIPARSVSPLRSVAEKLRQAEGRSALVRAPGGYGKTSQMAAWLADDPRRIAWIVLGRAERDPAVLARRIASSLRGVVGTAVQEPGDAPRPPDEVVCRALRRAGPPFVLVLDDVQEVEGVPAIDLLDLLVQNVPAGSTVVLVGRSEPPMHVARWRCNDALVDITASDLLIGEHEAAQLLGDLGVTLAGDDIRRLVEETEGWPAGIRLAALALQETGDRLAPARLDALGRDRAVARYLREEWVGALRPGDKDLLLRCSGLTLLSGPLCDSVLGRSDSGERLERLSRDRSMVVALDDDGRQYRLHGLLRQVLADDFERSDRDGHRMLAVRASEWFEAADQIDEAVHHAVAAGDLERAARLIRRHAPSFHTLGEYRTVERWVQALDRSHLIESPALCLIASLTALGLGDHEAAAAWVRFGTRVLETGNDADVVTGFQLATLRSLLTVGPIGPALVDALLAHEGLPPGNWHAGAAQALGLAAFAVGDLGRARDAFAEAVTEARLVGAITIEAISRSHLAIIDLAEGNAHRARTGARAARSLLHSHQLEHMPTLVLVTAMSAVVEAMDGDLPLARAEAALTRQHLPRIRSVGATTNVQARLALAHTALLCGDRDEVRSLINETKQFLRSQPDAVQPRAQIEAIDAQLAAYARTAIGRSSLSNAELRVLHYLPTNLSLADIGQRLYISRNTAKTHAAAVYRKLNVTSRSDAVVAARAAGLLSGEDPDGPTP